MARDLLGLIVVIFNVINILSMATNVQHIREAQVKEIHQSAFLFEGSSPCMTVTNDVDTIVNCSGRSLSYVLYSWFPSNTTILLLNKNALKILSHSPFSHLTELRRLDISENQLESIERNTFSNLHNLVSLNLEMNNLDLCAFPFDLFYPLLNLEHLGLRQLKDFSNVNLTKGMFGKLKNLNSLSMDTFGKTLYFSEDFTNLTKLSHLELTGYVENVTEKSFENIKNVRELYLVDLKKVYEFNDFALGKMEHLDTLFINNIRLDLRKLSILKPLQGKNMTLIHIERFALTTTEKYTELLEGQGVLGKESAKYIINICVKELHLIDDSIFVIEQDVLSGEIWDKCLKTIKIINNPLQGTRLALVKSLTMRHLENIYVRDIFKSHLKTYSFLNTIENLNKLKNTPSSQNEDYQPKRYDASQSHHYIDKNRKNFKTLNNESKSCESNIKYYISNSIRYVDAARLLLSSGFPYDINIVGGENVKYFDLTENGLSVFTCRINGLTGLQTFILSGNDMSSLSVDFFDNFLSIEFLGLSNCNLGQKMTTSSNMILQSMPNLKALDLSSNSLTILSDGTFSANPGLIHLLLAGNRFREIPFDLVHTPLMRILDLRDNALTTIDQNSRDHFDWVVRDLGDFHLLLSGNILSCSCQNIQFLEWIFQTNVNLDNNGNYTCIDNEGKLSHTHKITDSKSFWRNCWGQFFLNLSVVLLFATIIGFLIMFLLTRNKTYILSKVLQMFTDFKLKVRSDYQIGVFIGYSDRDYRFACNVLREFIEHKIGLTTYIRDRDLLPSSDIARGLVEAINSSWRIVLVVNQSFLTEDEWLLFTFRAAMYAMTPSNPSRVIIIVEEKQLRRIPAEWLSSVSDDNIIVLSQWELTYELNQTLRHILL